MSRIIFLDIDGVLNDWERSWRDVPDYNPELVPRCVQNFNRIIRATEAKVVISSSWRGLITSGHMSLLGFERLLTSHSVRAFVVGCTRNSNDEFRWQEIAAWLKEPTWGGKRQDIHRYCILDDDPDAFGGRPGVLTNGGVGLTERDADAAIEILGG